MRKRKENWKKEIKRNAKKGTGNKNIIEFLNGREESAGIPNKEMKRKIKVTQEQIAKLGLLGRTSGFSSLPRKVTERSR